jgi:uncharacterized protein
MIVVVDTNVWISGILNKSGMPRQALERALAVDRAAICPEIEWEIEAVFERKFRIPAAETRRRLSLYLAHAIRVAIHGTVHGCRDPKDDMVLECAVRAKAKLIVTGDKDLLDMRTFRGIRIRTARQYVEGPSVAGI